MPRAWSFLGSWLRRLGIAALLAAAAVIGGFGFLQTPIGRDWAVRAVARAASGPGTAVAVEGLHGFIPFDMSAARLAIGDDRGVWLELKDVAFDLSADELIAGRARVRALTARTMDVARWPAASPDTAAPVPLSQRLRVPHLPIPLRIDRVAVGQITLASAIAGEVVAGTLAGSAAVDGETLHAALDVHRIDDKAGSLVLRLALSGTPPALMVRLTADEPTGALLDQVLRRRDRLPLSLSLTGEGPVTAWHGQFAASAGALARLDADINLAANRETRVTLSGVGAVERLLPPGIAPLIGNHVPVRLRASVGQGGTIALDDLSVDFAAGTVTGDAALAGPDRAIAAHLRASLPRLAASGSALDGGIGGSAELTATISGTEERPRLDLDAVGDDIAASAFGAQHAEAHLVVTPPSGLQGPGAPFGIAAHGVVRGISLPGSMPPPASAPAELTWSLDARASPDNGAIEATIDGRASGLRTGVAAIDALGGGTIAIAGSTERDGDGLLRVTHLTLSGAGAELDASGRYDPATRQVGGALDAEIGQIRPLGAALALPLAGRLTARVSAEGTVDHPRLKARIEGVDLAAGPALLNRLQVDAEIADLAQPQMAMTGEFHGGGLDGTLSLDADLTDPTDLTIRRFQVKAADGVASGELHIDLPRLLARGGLRVQVPDLARWSRLVGMPVASRLDLNARLAAERGQSIDLTLHGDRLAAGAGMSRVAIDRVAASARLNDLSGLPAGKAQLSLTRATFPSGSLANARVTLDGSRPGRFGFAAEAHGKLHDPLTLAVGGDVEIAPRRAGLDLRIARLSGSLGPDHILLTRPLRLSQHGTDLIMSDLALAFGKGQITGSAARRGRTLSMRIGVRDLSVASAARLAGYRDAAGTLTLQASVDGTVSAPQAKFALSGRALRLALPDRPRLPTFGLDLDGTWNGRQVAVNGQVKSAKGQAIRLTGSAPLVLHEAPFALSVPPQGRLMLRSQCSGQLAEIADLLPLGEDRVRGHYALDLAVAGTVASPAASGRLTLADGRYENFATGAVLNGLRLDVAGDRDRLVLRDFSASDSADGTLSARGSLVLNGASPSADLTATLKHFRVAARDEAVVGASGTVTVGGTIASPKVAAQLTVDGGDITIPDRLPASVVQLNAVEIHGRHSKGPIPPPQPQAFPAALDIELAVPGRVFVRGYGLDSEWRGKITVTGTSAAPKITGSLNAQRGTVSILGKSFRITRGQLAFDGGASPDPALDIVAEIAAGDVTAQVVVGGLLSSPTITLSSTPVLPQDEILARVLFGQGVGQITPAEGLQVAQAAATLAGGGPGMLDRLRGRLGLDRLFFGSAPAGVASSTLNPASGGNAAAGTSVSGGKYVAQGVYVGAAQGLTPQSSKVNVEIEVRPHVTVETDLSRNAGTGIGLNYKYDY